MKSAECVPDYARLRPGIAPGRGVAETAGPYATSVGWTERHLQCVWSDAALRPAGLVTLDREPVEVEDPGRWNLEAGPDFLDAVLRVGPERRRIVGDVEVHIRPADWSQHGHGADARYGRVAAHVTYFPSATPPEGLPDRCLRVALRDALLARPAFAFEDIDVSAYPHAVLPLTPRPCAAALGGDPDRARGLLASAGACRFGQRCLRIGARIESGAEPRQLFYEEFMAALGYKQNQAAFRQLAHALPLASWTTDRPAEFHYARLLGAAGLLPAADGVSDDAARRFLRALWDTWWRDPAPAPPAAIRWRLDGLRPANHPRRRLAAAAAVFADGDGVDATLRALAATAPDEFHAAVAAWMRQRAVMPHWESRQTLTGPAGERPAALLGAARTAALCNNVIAPFLAVTAGLPAEIVDHLPPEEDSEPIRATAARLLGRDHNPVLYSRSGRLQQGLLQIRQDFCLNARTGCAGCGLADSLR
jgi:hypothetical protein